MLAITSTFWFVLISFAWFASYIDMLLYKQVCLNTLPRI